VRRKNVNEGCSELSINDNDHEGGGRNHMAHVLIMLSLMGGAINGAVISTQEFTSAERCEAVRLKLSEYAKARNLEETLRIICAQK